MGVPYLMTTRTDGAVGCLVSLGGPTSSFKGILMKGDMLICLLDLCRQRT